MLLQMYPRYIPAQLKTMNGNGANTIRVLRQQLVQARIEHDLAKLVEVENKLRELATAGYRCCLIDYEACKPTYYVRLLSYEKARVKVELEFPIEPWVDHVQWLPLSHLADYGEACSREEIRGIYAGLAPFIQHKTMKLERAGQNGHGPLLLAPAQRNSPENFSAGPKRRGRHRGWLYVGGFLLLMSLAFFAGMQIDRFSLLNG